MTLVEKTVDKLWIKCIPLPSSVQTLSKGLYAIYSSHMSQTYQPSKKSATTHGFLVRSASATGRRVLQNRRRKVAQSSVYLLRNNFISYAQKAHRIPRAEYLIVSKTGKRAHSPLLP